MGPDNFWDSGMWIFPMIMMVIMLVVVLGLFGRRALRRPWSQGNKWHHSESHDSETPMDILKKRYAKGEITKEEFEQMKKDI
jgi:putative membrane protein